MSAGQLMVVVQFRWGGGADAKPGEFCLLAPGLPDRIFASGGVVGWLQDNRIMWLHNRVGKALVLDGQIHAASNGPRSWMVVSGLPHTDTQARVVCFDPRNETICSQCFDVDPALIRPGGTWLVIRNPFGDRVMDGRTGESVSVPWGARHGRVEPWTDDCGLVWHTERYMYRMRPDGRVQSVGAIADDVKRIVAGPQGAAVIVGLDSTWVLPRIGRPLKVFSTPTDADNICFDDDGNRVLMFSPDGLVVVDCATARICSVSSGDLLPTGFLGQPLLFDEDSGVLTLMDGDVHSTGWLPAPVCIAGDCLYGPGGATWSLHSGASMWQHPALSSEFVVESAQAILCIDDTSVAVLGFDGDLTHEFQLPDGVIDAGPFDGGFWFETDSGFYPCSIDGIVGKRLLAIPESQCSPMEDEPDPWGIPSPIPVDGQLVRDRGIWVWSDCGELGMWTKP